MIKHAIYYNRALDLTSDLHEIISKLVKQIEVKDVVVSYRKRIPIPI
jgi:hypothetical protein